MTQPADAEDGVWTVSCENDDIGPIPQDIGADGSRSWNNQSTSCRRRTAECMVPPLKQLDHSVFSRTCERQRQKRPLQAMIINTLGYRGMPESVRVGTIAPAARGRAGQVAVHS